MKRRLKNVTKLFLFFSLNNRWCFYLKICFQFYYTIFVIEVLMIVVAVGCCIMEDPNESIRHCGQQLKLSSSTLWRFCEKILVYKFLRFESSKKLNRLIIVNVVSSVNKQITNFRLILILNRKSCLQRWGLFLLNVYVIKQNYWIWVKKIRKTYIVGRLYWLCPYWHFLENDAGHSVTVNGECYRGFLFSQLNGINVEDLWFQHDGTT